MNVNPKSVTAGTTETKTQFGDLRGWIEHLKKDGELHEINTEVDWDCELGTITRRVFGNGEGPALLFNRIKDYTDGRCTQLFTGGLSNYSRVAMMFGLPKNASITGLGQGRAQGLCRAACRRSWSPTGPVKENILKGDDIDLFDFPVPRWHRLDGGRYINTMQGTVTRDPVSGRINVGIYRGMIGKKDTIPVLLWRPQNWGQDIAEISRQGRGDAGRVHLWLGAVAAVLRVLADPARRLRIRRHGRHCAARRSSWSNCETVPLQVPASAEIVIEGWISPDPATFEMEGPFGEYTGYFGGDQAPSTRSGSPASPTANNPIFRGTLEGTMPKMLNENSHHEFGAARRIGLEHPRALRRARE